MASRQAAAQPRRRRRRRRLLYEQYLADSGSDVSDSAAHDVDASDDDDDDADDVAFVVGMDVSVLVRQTENNELRSVCLDNADGVAQFGDAELAAFVAALRHNTSIVSLQLRYVNVTDVSLVPLCGVLESHPALRALDVSGTHGGAATSAALRTLVCRNASVLFVRHDDAFVRPCDAAVIAEATWHNALACADATSNPFHLGLLRKLHAREAQAHELDTQLHARPWLTQGIVHSDTTTRRAGRAAALSSNARRGARAAHTDARDRAATRTTLDAHVCALYMQGRCAYGSRCRYFHPERHAASAHAAATTRLLSHIGVHDARDALSSAPHDAHTASAAPSTRHATATTAGTTGTRSRLQSRLRPAHFHLSRNVTLRNTPQQDDAHVTPTQAHDTTTQHVNDGNDDVRESAAYAPTQRRAAGVWCALRDVATRACSNAAATVGAYRQTSDAA